MAFEGERRSPYEVRLMDVQGRLLKVETVYGSTTEWQLNLPAGLYLIHLFQDGVRLSSKKLVLQNH